MVAVHGFRGSWLTENLNTKYGSLREIQSTDFADYTN